MDRRGYFSQSIAAEGGERIEKLDTALKIPLSLAFALADELGVSVDTLVTSDLASMTSVEQSVISFLGEIAEDTKKGTLEWDKFLSTELPVLLREGPNGQTSLPLFSWKAGRMYYHSAFATDNQDCFPCGDLFATDLIKHKTRAFLFRVGCHIIHSLRARSLCRL